MLSGAASLLSEVCEAKIKLAEIPLLTGGRNCIYKFDFATIAVPGPNYGRCQPWIPSSGAVHGRFLNDN